MPSKTKNRRAKGTRRHRKGTMRQRGGDWMHTLSFGFTGTADDPTTPKQTWAEWAGIKSDPSGKSWWDRLTSSNTSADTNYGITTNPMQPYIAPESSSSSSPSTSSLSNSVFAPDATTYNPMQTDEYNKNGYNGGKKSKSRSCHRKHKHKHTKSCSK